MECDQSLFLVFLDFFGLQRGLACSGTGKRQRLAATGIHFSGRVGLDFLHSLRGDSLLALRAADELDRRFV